MNTHRFNLVLPEQLWQLISSLAKLNHRSVTQEIVAAIEKHLATPNLSDIRLIAITQNVLARFDALRDSMTTDEIVELLNRELSK